MPAAIYTEAEVQGVIAMRKFADRERWDSRKYSQRNAFDRQVKIPLEPDQKQIETIHLWMILRRNFANEKAAIILHGKIGNRLPADFGRYDLQRGSHSNPDWFPPPKVRPNKAHRHIYQERGVTDRSDGLICALELPDFNNCGTPNQLWERLIGRFVEDMNIEIRDSEAHSSLFQSEF